MFEFVSQQPPAIIALRDDARAIARLRLYGDDCVLMGWTGNYKSDAPVAVFLGKADVGNVSHSEAVAVLLEETQIAINERHVGYAQGISLELAAFLSVTCPELARRFPET